MWRQRVQNGLRIGPQLDIYQVDGYGVKTNTAHLQGAWVGQVNAMTDNVVESFRKRQAAGEVFFNPLFSSKVTLISSSSGYLMENRAIVPGEPKKRQTEVVGNWLDVYVPSATTGNTSRQGYRCSNEPLVSPSDIRLLCSEVSTSVLGSRGVGPSNGNMWESLAQANQIASLLRVFSLAAYSNLIAIIKSDKFAKKAVLPASAWLMWRYGLRPLISDLKTAINAVTGSRGKKRVTTRAQLTSTASDVTNYTATSPGSISNFYHRERKHTVTVRGMSLDEYYATVLTELDLTLKGLITVPYDLVTLSFVFDWFVNLGDFFRSYVPAVGFTQLGSCLVIKNDYSYLYVADGSTDGTDRVVLRPISGVFTCVETTKERRALDTPALGIRHDFRLTSFTRAADAVALVTVLLAAKFPALKNAWGNRKTVTS